MIGLFLPFPQRRRLPKATALAPHSLHIWTKESCEMGGDSPKKGEAFSLSSKELHTEKRVELGGDSVLASPCALLAMRPACGGCVSETHFQR